MVDNNINTLINSLRESLENFKNDPKGEHIRDVANIVTILNGIVQRQQDRINRIEAEMARGDRETRNKMDDYVGSITEKLSALTEKSNILEYRFNNLSKIVWSGLSLILSIAFDLFRRYLGF